MATTVVGVEVLDIRTPPAPYLVHTGPRPADPHTNATAVFLHTDDDALTGYSLTLAADQDPVTFSAAVENLAARLIGFDLAELAEDPARTWQLAAPLGGDATTLPDGLLGPATGAVVNALWDLWARFEGKPLWQLIADLSPEQFVQCIDFRYLTDALTPDQAIELLRRRVPGKAARTAQLRRDGLPAHLTGTGRIGLSDDELRTVTGRIAAAGFAHLTVEVGRDLNEDIRRCRIVRDTAGRRVDLLLDANETWDVPQAIEWIKALRPFEPAWIEGPTSAADILGHVAIRSALQSGPLPPVGVAGGQRWYSRVQAKQALQAQAVDYWLLDPARSGGINEVLAVLLLAARFNVPVCPHGEGLGLATYAQHLAAVDYVAVGASLDHRVTGVSPLRREWFIEPVHVNAGQFRVPTTPGAHARLRPEVLQRFTENRRAQWRSPAKDGVGR